MVAKTTADEARKPDEGREPEVGDQKVEQLPHEVELVREYRQKKIGGREVFRWQPVSKIVPVVLVTSRDGFTPVHEVRFRQGMKTIVGNRERLIPIKKHEEGGELFFEVGFDDATMKFALKHALDVLHGLGHQAEIARRPTSFLSRREW